ncbi:putative Mediator of RNA polymerase II transcription subunit 20 [Hypsibius exemplaris]|uniref:Mediator of RNA polymerase II transcription subunit 20 n=1 Tax=Hypsibius exemplaris TaxID=2072580 RepID=A0A9X6RJV6_HYPEX|nr:putative Mediator of RNA polymerase II transcription subunit 20 [Hypsibius exemplaris]
MGITWVLVYPTPEGKTHNQALEDLGKQLLAMGFEKDQPYTVECETYFPVFNLPGPPKIFHVILDSDRPASCFLVPDKDPLGLSIVAERSFMGFLGKLSKAYSAKKSTNVEVKGTSYLFHDFTVRPGVLTIMGSVRGIVLETELRSCPVLITAVELMKEFVNTILPTPIDAPPPFLSSRIAAGAIPVSHLDTVLQYFDMFKSVRNSMIPK